MDTRAIILAAGLGTRLRPLTDHTPKALLPFRGKTMLEHVVDYLKSHGITEVVINVHHHAGQVEKYLLEHQNFGINIHLSDERRQLMDTGGGIVKARKYLEETGPFIVHNVDIFSDTDLTAMLAQHVKDEALATLAISDRKSSRQLLVDADGLLCGWRDNRTGEEIIARHRQELRPVAFSAIHVVDPRIFRYLDRDHPFSITKAYLQLAAHHRIMTFDHSGDTWTDMADISNFSSI
ncbi:MAG: nucleotidyltransferase family protein [Bacteroidales bacterium]|nr:nucleotidyltransferase family protein [Bacteroidales bacterium]MDT8430546.1 nucleotidyltransferase family protein [Bacteroidales bacterium]